MKTKTLLSLSFLLALSGLFTSVGCAPANPGLVPGSDESNVTKDNSGDDDDDDDNDDNDDSSKSSSSKSTSTDDKEDASSDDTSSNLDDGMTEDDGTTDDTGSGDPAEDEYFACMDQCIGNNSAAQQVGTSLDSVSCGEQDDACWDNAINTICQSSSSGCDKFFSCDDQCWTGN